MKENLKPLRDRVIVQIIPPKEPEGIIVVTDQQPEFFTGKVLAIGPNVQEVQVGQLVGFHKFNGSDLPTFSDPDARLRTMVESDIAFEILDDAKVE